VALPTLLEALEFDGQCLEVGWPYLQQMPTDLASWIPPATAIPVYRQSSTPLPTAIDSVIATVGSGVPMVMTILLGERFYTPANGLIEPGPDDADTDYHAVLAVGHGRDGPRRFVLIRNSWGDDWGLDGHAWVDTAYLEPRLYELAFVGNIP
jgi:hypothetical protein